MLSGRVALGLLLSAAVRAAAAQDSLTFTRIAVTSSIDGTSQPSNLYVPPSLDSAHSAPLAVLLHTWSFTLDQRHPGVEREAARRGWLLLVPNFRGRNDHPEACGAPIAQQDILDAVAWVVARYPVDRSRIYVLGMSGGGHMTLLVTARAPTLWAAASAWVGIGDLASYYHDHASDGDGEMTRRCTGGAPDASPAIAAEYRVRSPIHSLGRAAAVPIDIAAGRLDPEVAMSQSVRAFNALAEASGSSPVSESEIAELAGPGEGLAHPFPTDTAADSLLGRRIYLRRQAGPSRLTIFAGKHEWVPHAAITWLATHRRPAPK
jgi:dipeptidyl aminopeptidase/acylaminoacyl peptidase